MSTSSWGVRSQEGYLWTWVENGVGTATLGTVYVNSGTLTVKLPYAGPNAGMPTLMLYADPQSLVAAAAGTTAAPEVSEGAIKLATGQIQTCSCNSTSSALGVPSYNNLQALTDPPCGYGWSMDVSFVGNGMLVTICVQSTGPCGDSEPSCYTFLEPQRNYLPLHGSRGTLTDCGSYLALTTADGTIYEFTEPTSDSTAYSSGSWLATISPGGESSRVVSWQGSPSDGRPLEVQDSVSATAHASESELYTYIASGPNAGLNESITYRTWNTAANGGLGAWENVRQVNYTYYQTGDAHGRTGDLESVTTKYWNGSSWSGNETYYYRYYTGPTYDASGKLIGFAHGLERELLPAAYSALATAVAPGGTAAEQLAAIRALPDSLDNSDPNALIANYTCFYYQYDAARRVTLETVYGKLRTETYAYTAGASAVIGQGDTIDGNAWTTKTVETRADGSTYTVYCNYLGQTILSDLADTAGNHTYAYNQYDSQGHVVLAAPSSSISGYTDDAGSDWHIQVTATGAGPVERYTYYTTTTATETTAGGVKGYLQSTSLAHGLNDSSPVLQEQTTYYRHTTGSTSLYVTATDTVYSATDGTGGETTSTATTWYTGTAQEKTVITTLPVVSTAQNGSGVASQTVSFYDAQGNLTWTKDARGTLTHYIYDAVSGLLTESIEDADTSLVPSGQLPIDPTTGLALATPAGAGQNLVTDYTYDSQDRLVQTLGPVHTANGQQVRAATWTVSQDALHQTISASGYATQDTSGAWTVFTLLDPVWITITNADGDVVSEIQAKVDGLGSFGQSSNGLVAVPSGMTPTAALAAIGTFPQSSYTSWTTYQYSHKQLVSTRVYYAIPTSGAGTASANYHETDYGYDAQGRQIWTKTPGGTITWNVLDARGNTLSTWIGTNATGATATDPTGGHTAGNNMVETQSSTYDADGDVLSTIQYVDTNPADNRTTSFVYDSRDRLIETINPADAQGRVTYTLYQYDNLGEALEIQAFYCLGTTANPSTDRLLAQATYSYDTLGRVYRTAQYAVDPATGAVGAALLANTWYDAAGNVVKETDPMGNATLSTYNSLGQLATATDSLGHVTTYAYDAAGEETAVTDALGHTTTTAYDGAGRQTSQTNALGATAYVLYDAAGNAVAQTDALGHTTTSAYNAAGQVLSTTDALDHTTTSTYTADGQQATVTDALGHTTTATYDLFGNPISTTDALGHTTTRTYNLAGEATSTTDALGHTTSYTYDADGRVLTKADALGNTTHYAYDANGQLLSTTDAKGNATTTAYNAVGEVTGTTDAEGNTTSYTYDAVGSRLTLTDASGNTTTSTYDAEGHVLTETNALGATRHYVYDADGKLVQATDRDGRVTQYTYDALERETEKTCLDSSGNTTAVTNYAYDSLGHLLCVSDPAATYTYSYNAVGNVTSQTQVIAGLTPVVVLTYQFNAANQCTQVSETIGGTADAVTEYSYDALGRVTSIRQHGVTGGDAVAEKRIDFTYDAPGQYATITQYADLAGTELVYAATYTFDAAYQLEGLVYTKGTTTLESYAYTHDADGLVTSMTNADGTVTCTYDAAGQLISAGSNTYAYDDTGNRTGTGIVTGTNNELLSDGTFNYTYDAEGNRVSRTRISTDPADDYLTLYTWDNANRLTSVTFENNSGQVTKTVAYLYDAFNHWIGETITIPGETGDTVTQTRYVYDGNQIISQFDKTGTGDLASTDLSHRYLWDSQAVDHLFADEQVTSLNNPGSLLYALTDHENSIRDLATYNSGTDTTTIANHRVLDAYGNLKSQTNAAVDCLFDYTGKAYDQATGLQNNDNRWYEAITGRWLSQDPIGFGGGDANLYRYCGNDPVNGTDPDGNRLIVIEVENRRDPGEGENFTEASPQPQQIAGYRTFVRGLIFKLKAMEDARFEKIKTNGSVTFAKKEFKGNRQAYIARLERELTSRVITQRRGGVDVLATQLQSVVRENDQDYDISAVEIHSSGEDLDLPAGAAKSKATLRRLYRIGTSGAGHYARVSCYNNNNDVTEAAYYVAGRGNTVDYVKLKNGDEVVKKELPAKDCKIWFEPIQYKVRIGNDEKATSRLDEDLPESGGNQKGR